MYKNIIYLYLYFIIKALRLNQSLALYTKNIYMRDYIIII